MWLSGVEEMQEEGWVPNSQQWQRIRKKIDEIGETTVSHQSNTGQVTNNVVLAQPATAPQDWPMPEYGLSSGLNSPVDVAPIDHRALSPIFASGAPNIATKTPDSAGPYVAPFV